VVVVLVLLLHGPLLQTRQRQAKQLRKPERNLCTGSTHNS
jgi:hypothetical protein